MTTSTPDAVVVLGATGFTGRRILAYLARYLPTHIPLVAAGRRPAALDEVVRDAACAGTRHDAQTILRMTVDLSAPQLDATLPSLLAPYRGGVVVNAVGPYRNTGYRVVQATIRAGCHYVDVCGEPEFMERVALELHAPAKAGGVLVCSACGFDSIPADVGCLWTARMFQQMYNESSTWEVTHIPDPDSRDHTRPRGSSPSRSTRLDSVSSLTSITSYLSMKGPIHGHVPTLESAIMGVASAPALRRLRRRAALEQSSPPPREPAASSTSTAFFPCRSRSRRNMLPTWNGTPWRAYVTPFPGADASVVRRSLQAIGASFDYTATFLIYRTASAIMYVLLGGLAMRLATYAWGRRLILAFPSFFTAGTFTRQGPSEEEMRRTSFSMDFYAEGNVILGPKHGPHQTSGAKRVTLRTRVRGPEPGYVATPIMVSECAMVLLGEGQKVRSGLGGGGVYTPGRVFLDTSLVERLGRAGVVFEVVEDERRGTEGMETTPGEGKRKDR